ncbi:MAG: glycosyltransferase family protein [Patescibacteria group bacterium]|jgi:spore coat polysaccharide biosynthesis protein SpsF
MTGIIIQARYNASRLPGKVLKELPLGSGISVLAQVIRRLKKCQLADLVILATTENQSDDALVDVANAEKIQCYRGSTENLLERYYKAAQKYNLSTIVRITADCPCIDPKEVDRLIKKHLATNSDFTSMALGPRTYPHGIEVEVFSISALEQSYQNATTDYEKEHINIYAEETAPQKFKITSAPAPKSLTSPDIRITLDTPKDYTLLCAVYDFLYPADPFFDTAAIIKLFKLRPWLYEINRDVVQKKMYATVKDELLEAEKVLGLQELHRARKFILQQLENNDQQS